MFNRRMMRDPDEKVWAIEGEAENAFAFLPCTEFVTKIGALQIGLRLD